MIRRITKTLARRASMLALTLSFFACGGDAKTDEATSGAPRPRPKPQAVVPSPPRSGGSAGASQSVRPEANANRRVAQPMLWEVSGPSGTSYLFGTIHMGIGPSDLPDSVREKITETTTFISEVDMTDPQLGPGMLKEAMLPAGRSLEKDLGPDLWAKATAATGGAMPSDRLAQFDPWFVLVTITSRFFEKAQQMDPVLHDQAKREGDRLAYLETWQEQVRYLEESLDLQVLKDALGDLDAQKRIAEGMQRSYLTGDAAELERFVFDAEDMKLHPKSYEVLFYKRNERWLPVLERHLKEGKAFVAVGAGHLVGERGLVAELAKKGLTVTRYQPRSP
ncbi:MAG: TraB/GumN family protein [Polyangiaceae bacterium]|nr:TraB/GumN family protein [Polyangiaceae bacterium]